MSNASDLATKPERRGLPTPDRFERLGYGPRHARKPLKELDLRSQLMLEYMLVGCRHKDTCDRLGVEVNEPMSQQQASDAVGFRRRNGRFIFGQAVFQKALSKGIEELRSGNRVKAITTQLEVMNDRGDGSAAFAAVRLKASQAIMGDEAKGGVTVNASITNNTAIQLQPGIVIRLKENISSPPLEIQANNDGEHIDLAASHHEDADLDGVMIDPQAHEIMTRHWPSTTGDSNE
jgi:hypothetical protein